LLDSAGWLRVLLTLPENAKVTDPAKLKQQLELAEHIKKGA
jgi:hypothetical protein